MTDKIRATLHEKDHHFLAAASEKACDVASINANCVSQIKDR